MALRRPRRSVVPGRVAAGLTGTSICLHVLAFAGHEANPAAFLTAAMLLPCLICARHLWRTATLKIWAMTVWMNIAMIATHLVLMRPSTIGPDGGHHHTPLLERHSLASPVRYDLMSAAVTVAVVETALAAAVIFVRTRHMPSIIRGTGYVPSTDTSQSQAVSAQRHNLVDVIPQAESVGCNSPASHVNRRTRHVRNNNCTNTIPRV